MSQQGIESRMVEVEREQARQGERMGRIETRLGHHEVMLGDIGSGVKTLIDRDAKRPQALSWASIAGTCGGIATIAVVVWWLIGSSPAIVDLEKRVSKLDDPDVGRVPRLEKEVGWSARVTRYP